VRVVGHAAGESAVGRSAGVALSLAIVERLAARPVPARRSSDLGLRGGALGAERAVHEDMADAGLDDLARGDGQRASLGHCYITQERKSTRRNSTDDASTQAGSVPGHAMADAVAEDQTAADPARR